MNTEDNTMKQRAVIDGIPVFCRFDEIRNLDDLVENPQNPNRHPKEQLELLADVIKRAGWRQPITVSDRSGMIVKGHGRLQAARLAGLTQGPVEVQHYESHADEMADLLADNRIAELAEMDEAGVIDALREIQAEDAGAFAYTGFSEDDLKNMVARRDARDAEASNLRELFLAPPFSILKANAGPWQARKNAWINIGLRSEVGRGSFYSGLQGLYEKSGNITEEGLKNAYKAGTSIFDPVLCELMYTWFSKAGDRVLDPFAGGSVRGVVASRTGRNYTGIELREEQVLANRENAAELCPECVPEWVIGDSNVQLDEVATWCSFDMMLSCPPYADLEVYSDDPADISNMEYAGFMQVYRSIISKVYDRLADDRFAVWVIGEVRDKAGNYYNFLGDTIRAFTDAGFDYYNEMILETPVGTGALRAGNQFRISRKVCKVHQNVLVFVKGDGRRAAERLGNVEVLEMDSSGDE